MKLLFALLLVVISGFIIAIPCPARDYDVIIRNGTIYDGRVRQGGSTVTQQLVKNFFLTPERSLRRKLQEALMALIVEARYDKSAILEAYLNEIYLGQRGSTAIHGVGEASRHYFGKPASELELTESALLAAIIQSPNGLSPYRQQDAARERRDLVLRLMRKQGRIDAAALEAALSRPLGLAAQRSEPRYARYFLDALRRQLPDYYDVEILSSEGLHIYSTLDVRAQRLADSVLREELERLERSYPALARGKGSLQGCLIALRPQTGAVLALVGGRSYARSQFDRCSQSRRPAGSIFKPFVYAAGLEAHSGRPAITLASHLEDEPFELRSGARIWRPANYDGEFHGRVTVREAIESSLNVATARLGQQVGVERIAGMARRLGVESPLPRVASLALGSADVSPLEIARAYATLANGGIRPELRTFEDVVDAEGRAAARQTIRFQRVLDEGTAFLVTSLLQGVVEHGTARGLRRSGLNGPVAAKTGTSDEEHDAWLVGYTPELVVVVWVGFDEPRSLGIPASQAALPIWARFVHELTGGRIRGEFLAPASVTRVAVDPVSGARALGGCPRSEPEFFLAGTEPNEICPSWPDVERDLPGPSRPDAEPDRPGFFERILGPWIRRRSQ